jgi:hypothetical protein
MHDRVIVFHIEVGCAASANRLSPLFLLAWSSLVRVVSASLTPRIYIIYANDFWRGEDTSNGRFPRGLARGQGGTLPEGLIKHVAAVGQHNTSSGAEWAEAADNPRKA